MEIPGSENEQDVFLFQKYGQYKRNYELVSDKFFSLILVNYNVYDSIKSNKVP